MNRALFLGLAFVVFTSGCVIPGTDIVIPIPGFGGPREQTDDVVIITSFDAQPNKISPSQQTNLIAYVQNKGSERFANGGRFGTVSIELYDYCSDLYEDVTMRCGPQPEVGTLCVIDRLLPQEIKPITWALKAKQNITLPITCPPDGMKVAVRYSYSTPSSTTVSFIDPDEYQSQLERKTFKTIESQISAGEGPVKPFLTVEDQQPISAHEGSKVTFAFQIKNRGTEGQGFLVGNSIPKDKIIITAEDTELKAALDKCKEAWPAEITLIRKESSKYLCQIDVPANIISSIVNNKETTRTINIQISYEYEFRDYEKVTIEPKFIG